jgi:hypothetical protein
MLQAHSFLWHYLWVAPNVLVFVLCFLIWTRGLGKQFPAFFIFAFASAVVQLALYVADVSPSVSAENFWRVDWAGSLIEGPLKFVVIGEIFAQVFGSYTSLARLGKLLIRGVGVTLVLAAAVAAAYAPRSGVHGMVYGAYLLEQSIYLIEAGLLVFIFFFASYFRLTLIRPLFGIALGLSISACVHLATWAVMANGGLPGKRNLLDFLNMATYNLAVLIWCYYLLVPSKVAAGPAVPLPENHLDVWNRELERLVRP